MDSIKALALGLVRLYPRKAVLKIALNYVIALGMLLVVYCITQI